jgi:hypothetical protein
VAADGVVSCAVDATVGVVSRKVVDVPVVDTVVAGEVAAFVDIELNVEGVPA